MLVQSHPKLVPTHHLELSLLFLVVVLSAMEAAPVVMVVVLMVKVVVLHLVTVVENLIVVMDPMILRGVGLVDHDCSRHSQQLVAFQDCSIAHISMKVGRQKTW